MINLVTKFCCSFTRLEELGSNCLVDGSYMICLPTRKRLINIIILGKYRPVGTYVRLYTQ